MSERTDPPQHPSGDALIDIDLPDSVFLSLAREAHEKDITFNHLAERAVWHQLSKDWMEEKETLLKRAEMRNEIIDNLRATLSAKDGYISYTDHVRRIAGLEKRIEELKAELNVGGARDMEEIKTLQFRAESWAKLYDDLVIIGDDLLDENKKLKKKIKKARKALTDYIWVSDAIEEAREILK